MQKTLFLYFLGTCWTFAQVGINTETPVAELHVEGTMQLTNSLDVGGDDSTPGNSGNMGDILVSQGTNMPPKWVALEEVGIPIAIYMGNQIDPLIITANQYYSMPFNSVFIKNSYITYDEPSKSFTVQKSGFYEWSIFASFEINGDGSYDGTLVLEVFDTGLINSIGNSTQNLVALPLSGTAYLTEGQNITADMLYTRDVTLKEATLSIIYVSQ